MKILNTTESSSAIESLLDQAMRFVVIVSPYLKIPNRLQARILDAIDRCPTFLIYTRPETEASGSKNKIPALEPALIAAVRHVPNLHAKCYLNEHEALVSSLNLYEYSQVNNFELGVSFTRHDQQEGYMKLLREIEGFARLAGSGTEIGTILEAEGAYTVGGLYAELTRTYRLPRPNPQEPDSAYVVVSDEALRLVDFGASDLYQDGSRVLRGARLTKRQYTELFQRVAARCRRK
jgi:phosphatidylserine/phosphatidylglycerophosphate/cardiolipin synthase-like enzyme